MGKKLYVGNLTYNVNESDLEALFAPFGTVQSAQIIVDRDTNRSKGFGFVEMGSDAEAQAAIEGLNGQDHDGRNLTVNEAKPREARGGGGGGYGGGGVAAVAAATAAVAAAAVAAAVGIEHPRQVSASGGSWPQGPGATRGTPSRHGPSARPRRWKRSRLRVSEPPCVTGAGSRWDPRSGRSPIGPRVREGSLPHRRRSDSRS